MKKFFIILLSFFCLTYSPTIHSSQKDIQREISAILENLSEEDRSRLIHVEIMSQEGKEDELAPDDIEFYLAIQIKLKAEIDKIKEKYEHAQNEKLQKEAQARKNEAQHQIAEFKSQPQGPCPYGENDDKELIEILNSVVNLDAEITSQNNTHRDLETALACNDSVYNAQSVATTPYESYKLYCDGTVGSLKKAGKYSRKKTGPENEFQIQARQSQTNPNEYEIVIDGYTACDNLDLEKKPAHNSLAQKIYQQIGKTPKENSSTMQCSVEGKRYSGMLTSCSDAKVKITCSKELLKYLVKNKYVQQTPKRTWMNEYSDYRNAFCAERQKEIDLEIAEQDAYYKKIAEQKQQFARDRKEWIESKWPTIRANAWKEMQDYYNFSNSQNTQKSDEMNQADHKATDMQQLQQEESNKAC